jgi:polyisoprenyl-phosphate glycosyltransferase
VSVATQAERSPAERGRGDAATGQPPSPGPPAPVQSLPIPSRSAVPTSAAPTFSVVAPAYNEAENLAEFHAHLSAVMDGLGETWELVFVNDGSRDTTLLVMEALRRADPRIAIVNLSRNFGKEIATTAGLDHASGAAVILIDTDLQDPPEVIPQLVAGWRLGYDTVYAQRRQRLGETWLKRATAAAFYRILRRATSVPVPPDTGDFRLMSRRVVTALLQLREHHRFMKGLFGWVGFPSCAVQYDRHPRHAGVSAWNYWKLWNFALEGITSFTTAPLRVATYLGLLVGFGAAGFLAQLVIRTMLFGNEVPGYPSLMAVVLFLGGAQLITLGSIGEYLGRVFNEVKNRPLYFVEQYKPSVIEVPGGGVARDEAQTADRGAKVT